MTSKVAWVIGQINPDNHKEWTLCGVFLDEEKAVNSCRYGNDFVGPVTIGQYFDDEIPWPGAYYPKLSQKTKMLITKLPKSSITVKVNVEFTTWIRFRLWLARQFLMLVGWILDSDIVHEVEG